MSSVFKAKGSTPNHPIPRDEVEAIGGPYLEFARSWVADPIGTSSRAKVNVGDLAIGLAIVKVCTSKMNKDGTMPTAQIKAIWDKLFENGEVERAFDYHRWRVVRNLIEVQEGLTMVNRTFYTGFVNEQGHEIRGRAAQWHMASWLVEKLDDIVITGYKAADSGCQDAGLSGCQSQGETFQVQDAVQERISLRCEDQGDSLLAQDVQVSLTQSTENVPSHDRGELCWNRLRLLKTTTSSTTASAHQITHVLRPPPPHRPRHRPILDGVRCRNPLILSSLMCAGRASSTRTGSSDSDNRYPVSSD
jgi:hypothetical protein